MLICTSNMSTVEKSIRVLIFLFINFERFIEKGRYGTNLYPLVSFFLNS